MYNTLLLYMQWKINKDGCSANKLGLCWVLDFRGVAKGCHAVFLSFLFPPHTMQSKDEIRQRIQQLTGAIEKHKLDQANNSSRGGYAGAQYTNRPMSYSRTWTNRASPNKSVVFNGARNPPPVTSRNTASYNKQLVLNKTEPSTRTAQPTVPPPSSSSPHKKLVLNKTTTIPATYASAATTSGAPKQIEIGGVKFMVKGKKLIRQDRLKNQPLPSGMAAGSHVVLVRRNKRQVSMDASRDIIT